MRELRKVYEPKKVQVTLKLNNGGGGDYRYLDTAKWNDGSSTDKKLTNLMYGQPYPNDLQPSAEGWTFKKWLNVDAQNNYPEIDYYDQDFKPGHNASHPTWAYFPEGQHLEDIPMLLTKNSTFWAQWMPCSYTITFDAQGGTPATQTKEVTYGQQVGELPTARPRIHERPAAPNHEIQHNQRRDILCALEHQLVYSDIRRERRDWWHNEEAELRHCSFRAYCGEDGIYLHRMESNSAINDAC